VSTTGTFRDIHGRLVRLPLPSCEDQEAVAEFRLELNGRMAPAAVLERIRKHTALIAEGPPGSEWMKTGRTRNSTPPRFSACSVDTRSTTS
ncbi:MAG: hypothetical protein M3Y48_12405, partial [Actinomycetota bacterium]|nr:hypothetical protein [Actinomycetota bacterium]